MIATAIDITAVTDEQIDRCSRVLDSSMLPFYLVLSESDNLTEYKVAAIRKDGEWHLTCTCPAGLRGFTNCKAGYCKHVAWSVAASEEFKELLKAQAQADARITAEKVPAPAATRPAAPAVKVATDIDDVTLARIMRRDAERKAEPKKPARKVAYCQTRPTGFSLFK